MRLSALRSDESAEITQKILERALDEMLAAGIGGVEVCHAAAHMAMDMMPAFACRECLARELGYMLEVLEGRIEGVPNLPDSDVAMSCQGQLH